MKVRVNLANPQELLELPGLTPQQADAIVKFRTQHGPIKDAQQLATVLNAWPLARVFAECGDFAPADATAPEAPGA